MSSIARMKMDSTISANELATINYNRTNEIMDLKGQLQEKDFQVDSLSSLIQKHQANYTAITRSLKDAFPNVTVNDISTNVKNGNVYFSMDHRVLFNRGECELTSDGKTILEKVSKVVKDVDSDLMILGHTDSLPYYSATNSNWMLSLNRAHTVMKVMVDHGVRPEKIIIAGRSKYDPKFNNKSQIGRLLNRRIELVLMPDMDKVENLFADHINQ